MLESFLGLRCGNRVIKGAKGFNLPWICHDFGDSGLFILRCIC